MPPGCWLAAAHRWLRAARRRLALDMLGLSRLKSITLVTVEGKPFNSQMPAWAATLTDEQVAGVMTYARSEFGNGAPAVDAGLAKKIREETKARATPWTAEELKALEKQK